MAVILNSLSGSLSIFSGVIIVYYPGLKLPDSRSFQLFHSSQMFEQYDIGYRDNYWFERSNKVIFFWSSRYCKICFCIKKISNLKFQEWNIGNKMPLRWVWGVTPIDTGNPMDPASHGSLVLDPTFNISDPESQIWLSEFCTHLKGQPFYQSTMGPLLPNCFIENFRTWMDRRYLTFVEIFDNYYNYY